MLEGERKRYFRASEFQSDAGSGNERGKQSGCPRGVTGSDSDYLDRVVVLDTSTKWVYIGTLKAEDDTFFILEDADAFDVSDTTLSKHEYVIMVKKDGIVPNRKKVLVLKTIVTGITLLDDVLTK